MLNHCHLPVILEKGLKVKYHRDHIGTIELWLSDLRIMC
jgi:hypothetical protein